MVGHITAGMARLAAHGSVASELQLAVEDLTLILPNLTKRLGRVTTPSGSRDYRLVQKFREAMRKHFVSFTELLRQWIEADGRDRVRPKLIEHRD